MTDYLLEARQTPVLRFGYVGIPHDAATTLGNPGGRQGPAALREQIKGVFAKRLIDGRMVDMDRGQVIDLSAVEVADFGDVALSYYDTNLALDQSYRAVLAVVQAGYIPLIVGGDHAETYPAFKAFHDCTEAAVGLIQLDAHCDMLDSSDRQGKFSGSSGMIRSLELEHLSGKNMVQVGLRGYATTQQWGVGEKYGVHRILGTQFGQMGARAAAEQAVAWASEGTKAVYLTVDLDVLNPGEAPGTGWPEPGGLTVQELIEFVRVVAPRISAMDIAELNPLYDNPPRATAVLAARVLLDYITTMARMFQHAPV
jgi:arginase family enzyme